MSARLYPRDVAVGDERGGNWPTILCDVDGSKLDVAGSANSKLIVRKPVVR